MEKLYRKARSTLRLLHPDANAPKGERKAAVNALERLLTRIQDAKGASPPRNQSGRGYWSYLQVQLDKANRQNDQLRAAKNRAEDALYKTNRRVKFLEDCIAKMKAQPAGSESERAQNAAIVYLPKKGDIVDLRPWPGLVRITGVGPKAIMMRQLILDQGRRLSRSEWRRCCHRATHFEVGRKS
ncbi:MAG: hypothetical protein AAFV53_21020 [Myxococcota bacterium]